MSKRSLKITNGEPVKPGDVPEELASQSSTAVPPNEQDLANLAYRRWVERGRPLGSAEEDWFAAEEELRSRSESA